ncbi:MAG TPA: hypothetical protein VMH77_09505 [Steroidobacteraceae bacterium]|nr:hypothetical protein [Steroidobacteraceae bacterium]
MQLIRGEQSMKSRILVGLALLVLGAAATAAQAGERHGHRHRGHDAEIPGSVDGLPALGALLGGKLGQQFGDGGERVGAVAGTVIGIMLGTALVEDSREPQRGMAALPRDRNSWAMHGATSDVP